MVSLFFKSTENTEHNVCVLKVTFADIYFFLIQRLIINKTYAQTTWIRITLLLCILRIIIDCFSNVFNLAKMTTFTAVAYSRV